MIEIALLLAKITITPDYSVNWYCKNSASGQDFTLSYERRGNNVKDVRITVVGTPRLYADSSTRWRAKPTGNLVDFQFWNKRIGQSGKMELAPDPGKVGHYRLRWSDVMGLNGHIPLGNEEQFANCVDTPWDGYGK